MGKVHLHTSTLFQHHENPTNVQRNRNKERVWVCLNSSGTYPTGEHSLWKVKETNGCIDMFCFHYCPPANLSNSFCMKESDYFTMVLWGWVEDGRMCVICWGYRCLWAVQEHVRESGPVTLFCNTSWGISETQPVTVLKLRWWWWWWWSLIHQLNGAVQVKLH